MKPRVGPGFIAVLLVVGVCSAMAVEPTRQLIEQRHRVASMARDLRYTQRINEALESRITRLHDPDFLEQRAREQIGLVRPGETSYVVMPPSRRPRAAARPRDEGGEQPAAAAPATGWLEGLLAFVGIH